MRPLPSIWTPASNAPRCVRACRDEQVTDVIGLASRGQHAKIVFDMDDPMGASTCVGCGECVQACPTGALMPAREVALSKPDKSVNSLCPYCGVGCQLTYHVKDDQILYVEGVTVLRITRGSASRVGTALTIRGIHSASRALDPPKRCAQAR